MHTDLLSVPVAVVRRAAGDADHDLRRELFLSARPEFAAIPDEVRELLVELQLKAQRWQQMTDHPDVRHEVLITDGDETGCGLLTTAVDATTVHLVDIAVLPEHRNRGIGSAVVHELLDSAGPRDVRLFVWTENTGARRLYERTGFTYDEDRSTDAGHLAMVRTGRAA